MRGEEKRDEPSGPSESGISRSRADALDLERLLLTEVRRLEAARGAVRQISNVNVSGKESGSTLNFEAATTTCRCSSRRHLFSEENLDGEQLRKADRNVLGGVVKVLLKCT